MQSVLQEQVIDRIRRLNEDAPSAAAATAHAYMEDLVRPARAAGQEVQRFVDITRINGAHIEASLQRLERSLRIAARVPAWLPNPFLKRAGNLVEEVQPLLRTAAFQLKAHGVVALSDIEAAKKAAAPAAGLQDVTSDLGEAGRILRNVAEWAVGENMTTLNAQESLVELVMEGHMTALEELESTSSTVCHLIRVEQAVDAARRDSSELRLLSRDAAFERAVLTAQRAAATFKAVCTRAHRGAA